jgi:hypothetical protein
MNLQEDKATTLLILNLVAMLMFLVLPVVWFMVIGWSGLHLHKTMKTINGVNNPIGNAADTGNKFVTKQASKLSK